MFLLFELAKHPEIQERLHQEIKSTIEKGKHPTWEDIQNMKLVRNCIKETMRLYSPTGSLPRVLMEDTVLNGYQVPAGVSRFS
jgi:cytochrome P450